MCAAAECPLSVPSLGDVTDAALFGGQERLQEVRLTREIIPDARYFAAGVSVSVRGGEGFLC